MTPAQRTGAILGAADGLTIVVALLFGRNPAVFRSALDAGIGEFVGMGAALWLTDKRQVLAALLCGLATLAACVVPALPFIFATGAVASIGASALAVLAGAVICRLRPEKGLLAVAETYGILLLAGVLTFAISFLPISR